MKLRNLILTWCLFLNSGMCIAALELPKNLSASDRHRALEILGGGSAPKILSSPYPLGGYSGVEVGLSSEFIPIEGLSNLGDTTNNKGDLGFYNLSFSKGLYYNVDFQVYFTPYFQNEKIQTFGGEVRWGFWQSQFFPGLLSAQVSAGGANFANLINISNFGFDLIGTVALDNIAIYLGMGQMRSIGRFIGGADGITDSGATEQSEFYSSHSVFGCNVSASEVFFSIQIDRYIETGFSGKVGYRF